ncbi:hypothetical protein BCR33DRAFT_711897 [Rhizoclosmatium globosum]|uniref:Uncharacterized protein n=1 Tax=Rhizoclosmatium globosum TaxID=329046 RepID=A0A1Y2CMP5_9FUNG|nr:hypothetical protein BCR33DRAFT_714535 [Rhizoclosmatium globosum]ORY52636.1 hypothetical protein BCR33DRAFT_711897 [Rhizoclosmatium globosum]|eukprot:ORY48104.1 hypothetical protein BCR33DRAFT_714535 [Rhizoclosmatium globosum]
MTLVCFDSSPPRGINIRAFLFSRTKKLSSWSADQTPSLGLQDKMAPFSPGTFQETFAPSLLSTPTECHSNTAPQTNIRSLSQATKKKLLDKHEWSVCCWFWLKVIEFRSFIF